MGDRAQPTRSRTGVLLGSVYVRALVTVALLGYVASKVDWDRLADRAAGASLLSLAAAVALVVTALCLAALRWSWLLDAAGIGLRPREIARVYSIATFSGTFLPTGVGGDVARALLVTRDPARLPGVALSIAVDRFAAFSGLLAVAWLGLALAPDSAPDGTVLTLAIVTGAATAGAAFALWASAHPSARLLRRVVPRRFHSVARRVRRAVAVYARRPARLAAAVVVSIVLQALFTLQVVVIADGFDVELGFGTAAVTLALVTLATIVPFSIAGFGIREGSYVVLLGAADISATDATLISLSTVLVLLVASLPGAVMVILHGTTPVLSRT